MGADNEAGPSRRLRVAVIGCGAVARQMHLPVLAGHEGVELVALVDSDVKRAGELARAYNVPRVLGDGVELGANEVDAAVVATPPWHHAPGATMLMRRGIHVLVEKPIAISFAEAVGMVRTAEETGTVLAVGFFRRLMPSVRMLKGLIDSNWLGEPLEFQAEGGGMYNWSAATLGSMRKEGAGGGALVDYGSHLLDVLNYLFAGEGEVLSYRDNSRGGVEADCELRLRLASRGRPVEGTVTVARTRKLGNFVRVLCQRGSLEYRASERDRIWVSPAGLEVPDPRTGKPCPYTLQASWGGESEASWYETMRAEIDDWIGAIRTRREPELSARSTLPMARVMEECYRRVEPLPEPWVDEGLERLERAGRPAPRRVLVTGASGFIGCRVAEVLRLGLGCDVRAQVHNPANAARVARLPVELVQADLRSATDVLRLVNGCDAVVHCAVGTAFGSQRELAAVTVGGTRRLLRAAGAAGVKRFVHLSTIAVHPPDHAGALDEDTPVRPGSGQYGRNKARAERAVLKAVRAGLPAVILRPGCVYGPYSKTFTVQPLEALAAGGFRWVSSADSPSNTVYVDNLVEAVLRALRAPEDQVRGQAFTISDGDALTWREFLRYFADALDLEVPPGDGSAPTPLLRHRPLGWLTAWYTKTKGLLTSREFRALGRKFLHEHPLGQPPLWLLRTFPRLERGMRRLLKADLAPTYHRSAPAAIAEAELGSGDFLLRIDKARRVLGYTAAVPRQRALELTLAWVRHARISG